MIYLVGGALRVPPTTGNGRDSRDFRVCDRLGRLGGLGGLGGPVLARSPSDATGRRVHDAIRAAVSPFLQLFYTAFTAP